MYPILQSNWHLHWLIDWFFYDFFLTEGIFNGVSSPDYLSLNELSNQRDGGGGNCGYFSISVSLCCCHYYIDWALLPSLLSYAGFAVKAICAATEVCYFFCFLYFSFKQILLQNLFFIFCCWYFWYFDIFILYFYQCCLYLEHLNPIMLT